MDEDPPPKWGACASAYKANTGFQEQTTPTVDNVVSETPPAHAVQVDEPSEAGSGTETTNATPVKKSRSTKKRPRQEPVDYQNDACVTRSQLFDTLGRNSEEWNERGLEKLTQKMQGRHLNPCLATNHTRRTNCTHNPYCLFGFTVKPKGWDEESQGVWPPNKAPTDSHPPAIREHEHGRPTTLMGLNNQGATCYMNSLLQVLSGNLNFTRGLKSWDGSEEVQALDGAAAEGVLAQTKSAEKKGRRYEVCKELQNWLYYMEHDLSKSATPKKLTEALQCPPGEQMDLGEFNQLLMTLIHENLQRSSQPPVRHLVDNQFKIDCEHCVKCTKCEKVSTRKSWQYQLELPVKGNNSVDNALGGYLKKERLEGDNQYFCEGCNSKQDALIYTQLSKLPEVFCIHLMRFVFDLKTLSKRKVRDAIVCPDTLDMSKHVKNQALEGSEYQLTAVLMHKGPSAFSGHYVVQVKKDEQWSLCDDDWVDPVEDKNIGKVEDWSQPEEAKPKRKGKRKATDESEGEPGSACKADGAAGEDLDGARSSTTAYMLFYTRVGRTEVGEPDKVDHLKAVKEIVESKNKELLEKGNAWHQEKKKREEYVCGQQKLCKQLTESSDHQPSQNSRKCWIEQEWMQKLHTHTEIPKDGLNQRLLCKCSRGHIDPLKFLDMKLVAESFWDQLMESGYSGTKLPEDHPVCQGCLTIDLQEKFTSHEKGIKKQKLIEQLRHTPGDEERYYVSKAWVNSWKKSGDTPMDTKLNHDLVCDHRNLRTNLATSKYHSVTQEVWDQLKEYTEEMVDYESDLEFCKSPAMKKPKGAVLGIQSPAKDGNKTSKRGAYELKKSEGECAKCRCEETKEEEDKLRHLCEVKKPGDKIINIINRCVTEMSTSGFKPKANYFLISRVWFDKFRDSVRDHHFEKPENIDTTALQCEHGQAVHNLERDSFLITQTEGPIIAVIEDKWKLLKSHFDDKVEPAEFRYSKKEGLHVRRGQTEEERWDVCQECDTAKKQGNADFSRVAVRQLAKPVKEDTLVPPQRENARKNSRNAQSYEVDVDSGRNMQFLRGRIYALLDIPQDNQKLWMSRPGITGRIEISNRQSDTKLKDLPLFADSLIEVFETRKASAKEASVNLEQVVPSVETGFAGTALHCHD